MKGNPKDYGFSTRAIHAGQAPEPTTGAVAVPIFQTSTYVHDEFGKHKGFEYARGENPTRAALEENIAALEGGFGATAYASGMAAVSALVTLLHSGDRVVASRDMYGGTFRYFSKVLDRYGIEFEYIDTTDLSALEVAMTPETKMVYVETPTNPLMEITDLAGAAEVAHAHGAILAVDNTFLSPYLQRPLAHGADVVLHSATKFLNGHSDSLGGLLVAASQELHAWFVFVQKSAGAILGPMDCFLILRGIKTLGVRMDRHESNAKAIIQLLKDHPKVGAILYPGLPDHPGHEIQKRQASGFGGVLTFDVGSYNNAGAMLNKVQVLSLAESLGGVESLISHPASMTHASVPKENREKIGITDGLVRISVGIEDEADLVGDLRQALNAI